MAFSLYEKVSSRDQSLGQRQRVVLDYFIFATGADIGDDVGAHAFFLTSIPALYGGLALKDTGLGDYDGTKWSAFAVYSGSITPSVGNSEFTFDTTGGSWLLTQSLETKESSSDAPDFKQGINVGPDGAEGVLLPLPGSMAFEEKHYFATSFVTPAYKQTLMRLSRSVNSSTFKGLAAGEVYFRGVRGSLRDLNTWELTYFFLAEPNKSGIVTAPGITLNAADGFDYIWSAYRKENDSDGNRIVPFASYVEKVFERENLAALEIGT